MAIFKKPTHRSADAPTQHETTDVEDIQLLSDEVVALIQTSAYDDMTWAEIDAALVRASHQIKINWSATGSVMPAPEPPPPEPPAARR
jgi:hypothetical protein